MSLTDVVLIVLSAPFWVYGFYKLSWHIRFRRKARFTSGGVIIYKIRERNVK